MSILSSSLLSQRNPAKSGKKSIKPENPNRLLSSMVVTAFATPLSWMGILGQNDELIHVFVGHSSPKSIIGAAKQLGATVDEFDWCPELRSSLEAYAAGELVDFNSFNVRLPPMTAFQQKIVDATRQLAYGQTTSYGGLASQAGFPRAARAVGTVMSTNRFPILIPCHRVLAAGGKLGGYSSPMGTGFKQRLLELESRVVG